MELILLLLIGINVLVFVIPYIVSFGPTQAISFANFLQLGWKNNADITNGEYYRLLTATFLHSDIFHLAINMYSLWAIGQSVLSVFTPVLFLIIYLLSGIGGSLLSYFMSPVPSVGASGAIFGLAGTLISVAIITRDFGLLSNLALIIVINFFIAYTPGSRIDNYGHIGGLVTGIILGFILFPLRKSLGFAY